MIARRYAKMLPLVLGAVLLASCGWFGLKKGPEYLVPEADTAAEQFRLAQTQRASSRTVLDAEHRVVEFDKAILAYLAVRDRFPNDTKFTPAAVVFAANIHRDMQEYNEAVTLYLDAITNYPDQDDVRVDALYGLGKSYDAMGNVAEAKSYYKLLADEYADSPVPTYRRYANLARVEWEQIRPANPKP